MKKLMFIGLAALALAAPAFAEEAIAPEAAAVATPASAASVVVERREVLVSASGARVGNVHSINEDGSPRVIADQRMVTIPLSTLSRVDGRLTTSLSRTEVRNLD